MSNKWLVSWSAIIGGASAFLGSMVSDLLIIPTVARVGEDRFMVAVTCSFVGGMICSGVALVFRMAASHKDHQPIRMIPRLIAGLGVGAVGGILGEIVFALSVLPHELSWMIMGSGIGAVEGLYERSPAKLRNGLVGGALGGLLV
jgi:hypothetical protein